MRLDWVILGSVGRNGKVKPSPDIFQRIGARIVRDLAIARG